ncbi:arrestin Aly1 [Schizosaccharomyces japonicus yFS275]|uniref:Arrestin Aly1 n=1 Tax=Schizosaccharomyces japonicus (strain yFS275 / FY16936) TaxID=402676 RepID=B6JUT8_SCHJY|nr:arrestin Aly1 [Schizosaccharomyces japonicus yFS275]EEB05040.1 arrestin Aly1 [Schizosaccharomyces japonicus yFS275]
MSMFGLSRNKSFGSMNVTQKRDTVIRLTDRLSQPDPTKHLYQEAKLRKCEGIKYKAREWLLVSETGSMRVAISLAEPVLYLQGASASESRDEKSTVLRGAMCIHVLKTSRLKKIQLGFYGKARTEWPDGIPPKRTDMYEESNIMYHSWLFYHYDQKLDPESHGAIWHSIDSTYTDTSKYTMTHDHFYPGQYVYAFELPISCTFPESIQTDMGMVYYYLEPFVEKYGTFASNASGRLKVELIRSLSTASIASSEPIIVSRNWDNALHYEISITGKCQVMGQRVPILFKFTPLAQIKLQKLYVILIERRNYYCRQRTVHRKEKTRQLLVYEKVATNEDGNMLHIFRKTGNTLEFEDYVRIPGCHDMASNIVNFDTTYPNIKITHTLRTVLLLSRMEDARPAEKPKSYKIFIDSPIIIMSCRCCQSSTVLPAYEPHFHNSAACRCVDPITATLIDTPSPALSPAASIENFNDIIGTPPPDYDEIFKQ